MEWKDWLRIQKNWEYLKEDLNTLDLLDDLYSKGVINEEDEQRIKAEQIDADRTERFLRILKFKTTSKCAFHHFCESLREKQNHVFEKLNATAVDDEFDDEVVENIREIVRQILLKNFDNKEGVSCTLPDVRKLLLKGVESQGKCLNWADKEIQDFILDVFTEVQFVPGGKRKKPIFKNICLKEKSGESSGAVPQKDQKLTDQAVCGSGFPLVSEMSVEILCEFLTPILKYLDIDVKILHIIKSLDIDGKVFGSLSDADMEKLFPDVTFGKRRKLLLERNEILSRQLASPICDKEDKPMMGTKSDRALQRDEGSQRKYRESLRKFDMPKQVSDKYVKGRIVDTDSSARENILYPIRKFVHFGNSSDIKKTIGMETVTFSSACMNERKNGTIYFGISPDDSDGHKAGEVVGLNIDKKDIAETITHFIKESFCEDQREIAFKVIRDAKFVEVVNAEQLQLYVIEIDVVPDSHIVKEEPFYVKMRLLGQRKKKTKLELYRLIEGNVIPQNEEEICRFMRKKNELTEQRRRYEDKQGPIKASVDLRKKFLSLFTGGSDEIEDDIYPLLLLSPLDTHMDMNFVREKMSFLKYLDAKAILDFDSHSDTKGLYKYVDTEEEQVFQVLTTDNFDRNGEENAPKKETYLNFLENIRCSAQKGWIFCNGYECMGLTEMEPFEWKRKRSEGFKAALRFYHEDIPMGRAVVLIFLFSKNYETMLEAVDDVLVKFQDQWIVLAENDTVAELWKEEMLRRHCVDSKSLENRCILGIPWGHLNETINQVIGPVQNAKCELPTSTGAFCHLRERVKNDMCDLEILSRNECDNTDIAKDPVKGEEMRRKVEETFFQGGKAEWWNFWFREDHVLKRNRHKDLADQVKSALEKHDEEEDKVGVVTLIHQPGAGGTTSAHQILFDLKDKYRCCVVKRVTDQTCDQITSLRSYEDPDNPKPPLILLDNEDTDKVSQLHAELEDKARIIGRRSEKPIAVFCVLFLCLRRASLPRQIQGATVLLKQELDEKELAWFQRKSDSLERKFKEDKRVDPRFLISFNILKENFNQDYVKRTVKTFVIEIQDDKERDLLKYLALLNTYDIDFSPIPVSCFDPIMDKPDGRKKVIMSLGLVQSFPVRKKGWEAELSSSLRVLLNQSSKRSHYGSHIKTLRIINPLLSKEILQNLILITKSCISDIMMMFLNSNVFRFENSNTHQLMAVVKNVIKKRSMREGGRAEKFSNFILFVMKEEDVDAAANVLITVFEMTDDAFIAQQIARFYIHFQNWIEAEKYAKIATNKKHGNSFVWDTYGHVFKEQLFHQYKLCSESDIKFKNEKAKELIKLALRAIEVFRKEQSVSEMERTSSNNAGYFGEIRVIILLLNIISKFECYPGKKDLHRFLVESKYTPENMEFMDQNDIEHLKMLNEDALKALRKLEEEFLHLKHYTFDEFRHQDYQQSRVQLIGLKESLDTYFGEDSDAVPKKFSLENACEYTRRRVIRLGVTTLGSALALRFKQDGGSSLLHCFTLLKQNVESDHCSAFDLVNLLNTVVAINAASKEVAVSVRHQQLIDWSNKLYETKQPVSGPYLETYMYLILFNFPTENRRAYNLCPTARIEECIKRWKDAFHQKYPQLKEGKTNFHGYRRKDKTIFFLGKGNAMKEIVYYEELHGGQGDRVWRTPEALARFKRLEGILRNEGLEVSISLESPGGNKYILSVPTSLPITKRSMWQKRVFFVLGVSWSGPKEFDVTDEDPSSENARVHLESSKKPRVRSGPRGASTRNLNQIIDDIRKVEISMKKLSERSSEAKEAKDERIKLKNKKEALIQERDDLLRGDS